MHSEMELDRIWEEIETGPVDKQMRIRAAACSGRSGDRRYIPHLMGLLTDPEGEVRHYALQALVLDLKQKDAAMKSRCWVFLQQDPDEDVRRMAAACLGSCYFGSLDREAFEELEKILRDPQETPFVKDAIYTALFEIVGKPPMEWPSMNRPTRRLFQEKDIDWSKVAGLKMVTKEHDEPE